MKGGVELISELLGDPAGFQRTGRAYELLQCYFDGLELGTLEPLLRHEHTVVRKSSIFVASELGSLSLPLVDFFGPLTQDPDPVIQWSSLEAISSATELGRFECYFFIPKGLESSEGTTRRLAMRLLSRCGGKQLDGALGKCLELGNREKIHIMGLSLLKSGDVRAFETALSSDEPILQRYSVVAAKRSEDPTWLKLAKLVRDEDSVRFVNEMFAEQ